jgi:hypothetical protein
MKLKHLIILFCLFNLLGFGITYPENEGEEENVIRIELTDKINFNWDNSSSSIIDDSLFALSKEAYSSQKKEIIQLVDSKKQTKAEVCKLEGTLTQGQMAFIFLDQMEAIPYAKVFQQQYCVVYLDCPYIGGLIASIDYNEKASEQLMEYLLHSSDDDK